RARADPARGRSRVSAFAGRGSGPPSGAIGADGKDRFELPCVTMIVTLFAMALCFVLAAAGGNGDRPAQLARNVASKALGIPGDQFQVKSAEPAEWPDSRLGCARGKASYLPVVTRGH